MSVAVQKKSWWLWAAILFATLSALLVLLVHSLPGIGLMAASRWYSQQGVGYELQARDWRFSPLSGRLELSDVTLLHPGSGTGSTGLQALTVQFSVAGLFRQQAVIRQLTLDGAHIHAAVQPHPQGKQLVLAGLPIPLQPADTATEPAETEPATAAWTFALEQLRLRDSQLEWTLELPGMSSTGALQIDKASVGGLHSARNTPVAVNVALQLQRLALQVPSAGPDAASSGVLTDVLELPQPVQIQLQGELQDVLTRPRWAGDVRLNELQLNLPGLLQTRLGELTLSGMVADAEQQQIGHVHVAGLELQDARHTLSPLRLAELALDEVQNGAAGMSVQALRVQTLELGEPQAALLTLQQYRLERLEWLVADSPAGERRLNVGQQYFAGLELSLRRDADGQMTGLAIPASTAEQPEPVAPASAARAAMTLLLGGLLQEAATGNENSALTGSTLRLEDRSVSPPLQTTLTLYEVQSGAVTMQIGPDGPQLQEPVSLQLVFGMGRFNRIRVNTVLTTFRRAGAIYPQGDISVSVRQLDLVPFNGYLTDAIGYQVERGMLNLDARVNIHRGQLKGEVELLLRNTRFVPADEATIQRISKQISMPVDTALALLRDDNGNVRLQVPVSGNLTRPDVRLHDITRQLSQRALQQSALFYLRQSLQPYGAMLSLASYAGDYVFAIRLDALTFAHNSSEITAEHQQYLQKVAAIMQRKSTLEVMACPFVSPDEVALSGDNWPQLARERGDAVKAALGAIQPELTERVSVCRPQQGKHAEVLLGVN